MKLYEYDEILDNCIKVSDNEAVDTITGELLDIDYLEHLEMERSEKVENCIKFFKNCKAEYEAYKSESDRLKARASAAKNKMEQMKSYLSFCQKGEKFKSEDGLHQISFRRSEAVDISDIKAVPSNFLKYRDPEADKTLIKEALKGGYEVPGASLVEHNNITIK